MAGWRLPLCTPAARSLLRLRPALGHPVARTNLYNIFLTGHSERRIFMLGVVLDGILHSISLCYSVSLLVPVSCIVSSV